jgi:N-acetylglucosaminyl-diphospho-decaprenol L-rhamnosyltransferase
VQTESNLSDPQTTTVKPPPPTRERGGEGRASTGLTQDTGHQPYTVIVVSYNSQYWLEKHLPFYQTCQHLVIVDNASVDSTCDYVRSQLPQAKLIGNIKNQGFGAACNQGVASSTTPYALLLNPDCTCDHDTVAKLVAVAQQDPQAAIVAPQVITKKGTLEISYRMGLLAWKAKIKQPAQGLLCVEFVTGACLLLNRTAFDAVQGFDVAYFMYYEDEDLCLRLRRVGYAIVVEPSAVVQHFARSGSKQSGWRDYTAQLRNEFKRGKYHMQAKLLFYGTYQGTTRAAALRLRLLTTTLLSLPFRLLQPTYFARLLGRFSVVLRGAGKGEV